MYRIRSSLASMLFLTLAASAAITFATAATAAGAGGSGWVSPVSAGTAPDIVATFDPPAEPWMAGHRGVDIAAAPGTNVHSAGEGVVAFAGWIADRPVVSVSHGSLRTTYEPVEASVSVGQQVSTGEPIGTVALGGHCSSECLHWGLKRGEEYLDPLALLRLVPPVLKPLSGGVASFSENSRLGAELLSPPPPPEAVEANSRSTLPAQAALVVAGTLGIGTASMAFRGRAP